jgi:hypothetical protein
MSLAALLSTNEFVYIGTFYSLRFWTLPIETILLFYMIRYIVITYSDKKYFKQIFGTCFSVLLLVILIKFYFLVIFNRVESYYCPYKKVRIEFTNVPWYLRVSKVSDYIEKNTAPDDKILALPYNMFQLYIMNRESPTKRYNEFLYLSHVTLEDQVEVIKALEKEKVKTILYAVRKGPRSSGIGKFGKTHCALLDKYIKDNYEVDVSFYFKKSYYYVHPIAFFKRKTPFKDSIKKNFKEKLLKKYKIKNFSD